MLNKTGLLVGSARSLSEPDNSPGGAVGPYAEPDRPPVASVRTFSEPDSPSRSNNVSNESNMSSKIFVKRSSQMGDEGTDTVVLYVLCAVS